jgi:twitching motility protein PilT
MAQSPSRRLGEVLVARGALAPGDLERLLAREAAEGVPLARLLVTERLVSEKDLVAAVAEQVGLRFVDFARTTVHPEAERLLPAEVALARQAVVVEVDGGALVVAMADPGDEEAVAAIRRATGWEVVPAVAERGELARVVQQVYRGATGAAAGGAHPGHAGGPAADGESPAVVVRLDPEPPGADAEAAGADVHVNELLERVLDLGGSDLHLTAGTHPTVRVHGELKPLTEYPVLDPSTLRRMVYGILTQKQREKFENDLELDTSHTLPGRGRFRVNVFLQRDSIGAVMRAIPFEIVPLDRLGLPPVVAGLAELQRGLVLVTGPTGSGKSTTLASLLDIINATRPVHIMTVEDPIEFLHRHKRAIVNQREVGEDTHSFASALKHVLRQDPDVILVGEMRDLETIATAITAAETGHLVFATLHTQDAPQTVDRIIDVFPPHQQQQVRVQLASSLQAVVTQQLVPRRGGGRVVAAEVLIATPAIRNLIREGKTHQIASSMQAGGRYGMCTMDQTLAALVKAQTITMEVALERCHNEEDLRRLLGQN